MNRGVAERIRNLGKIHLLVTNHLFGRVYFHLVEAFHHAATLVGAE